MNKPLIIAIACLLAGVPCLFAEGKKTQARYEIKHDFEYDLATNFLQQYLEAAGALLELKESELPAAKVMVEYRESLRSYMKSKGYLDCDNCDKICEQIHGDLKFAGMFWEYVDLLEKRDKRAAARKAFEYMKEYVFKAVKALREAKSKRLPVRHIAHTFERCRQFYALIKITCEPWGSKDAERKKLVNKIWEDLFTSYCEEE